MTANGFTTAALRLLGILDETESPSAEQGETGRLTLASMMGDLQGDGIDVGFAPVGDVSAETSINRECWQAVTYLLAVHLAPMYTVAIPDIVAQRAADGLNKLRRIGLYQSMTPVESPLPGMGGTYNILTD